MAKLTLADVSNILGNPTSAANTINANSALIEAALENTLSRDGSTPNQMQADIDLNNNDLVNVDNIDANTLILDGEVVQVVDLAGAMKASNALSEIASLGLQSTARTNLGLGDIATHSASEFLTSTSEQVIDLLRIGCVAGSSAEAANNSTKLMAAISATSSVGYRIYVPGRFYVASLGPLSGKSLTITGSGPELSSLIATQTSGYFLDIQQDDFTDSVRLSGFSIETETVSVTRALRVQFNENDATNNRLQARCTIENVEIRGVDVGAHGFLSGIDLTNVHRPILSKVSVSGRQNGAAPAGFQHMEYGWNLTNVGTGVPTDFMFSFCTVIAAAKGYKGSGVLEGISFDRCYSIAVGRGFDFQATTPRPYIDLNRCHVAAFEYCVYLQNFWQSWVSGCLLYKREDSNANTVGIYLNNCDNTKVRDNNLVNVAGLPATFGNYDGIVLVDCDYCDVVRNELAAARNGVDFQGTTSNSNYVKGQWHDEKGTTTPVEYQVSGSGSGNTRRNQLLDVSNRNSGGAVVVTGVSAVNITSTATDTLEVGDKVRIEFSAVVNKDANAGHAMILATKAGTATLLFENNSVDIRVQTDCAASQTLNLRASATARVTTRGSCTMTLQGFAPANSFTVPIDGGQIKITRE